VGAGADAVTDRVRRVDGRPDEAVELGHRRPCRAALERAGIDGEQLLLELGVLRLQLTEHDVLRVVGPVPVRADPDLEEDGLAFDDGQVTGRGEGLDALA
jgi:hypothetical protein